MNTDEDKQIARIMADLVKKYLRINKWSTEEANDSFYANLRSEATKIYHKRTTANKTDEKTDSNTV